MTVWIYRGVAEPTGEGPLSGLSCAVKDNIDVAGMPTTCGCPAFSYTPAVDAECVARLRAAGATVVGKTNMDQFATGLVGTRSPYGPVEAVTRPGRVGGGSSSGSAAAVALGEVDFALGTDTAGSGRVPAVFQGIVGAKPSVGRVPTAGVVPACRSFDCVSVFARTVELAERVLEVIGDPPQGPAGAPPEPRVVRFEDLDQEPFLAAGELLYEGAFLSERYAAVGEFIESHLEECEPTVASIILRGRRFSAADYLRDRERLAELRVAALRQLEGYDALIAPTVPFHPTLEEVAADPVGVNARLGRYTTFVNLLGLCAYTLPSGESVLAPGGHDRVAADIARELAGESERRVEDDTFPGVPLSGGGPASPPPGTVALLAVGEHMSGLALNGELVECGATLLGPARTAAAYRLFVLDGDPPRPGLVRDGAGSIAGELWAVPHCGLGKLVAALRQPIGLGRVDLADGQQVVGFLCEPAALKDAREITDLGGWRAYLASTKA